MKLEQNIPNWNKDEVWSNIEDRLHPKKKRRFLYWRFFGVVSMVLLIGFLMWFSTVESANTSVNKKSIAKVEQKNHHKEIQNKPLIERPKTLGKKSKQDTESVNEGPKDNTNDKQQSMISKVKSNLSVIQSEEFVAKKVDLKNKKDVPVLSISKNIPFKKIDRGDSDSLFNEKIDFPDSLSMLPVVGLSPIDFNRNEILVGKNIDYTSLQKNEKKRISTLWWVESGISIGNKSFQSLDVEIVRDFTKEQFRFMQTNAIGIQKFLNKNWSLKLGLAYQTIYEKYEDLNSYVEEEEVFSEEAIVYELPNGVTYFEGGFATQQTTKTRLIINNNFIHRLSIPVELAYVFKKDRWSLEPSLGFRFQFFQHFDGIISQDGDYLFDLAEINDTYYSNDLGIGFIGSLNLKYHVFSDGALGIRLTYERDDFLNLIGSNYFFRYETVGLQLGYYQSF